MSSNKFMLSGGMKTLEFHNQLSLDSDPSYPYSPKAKNTSQNSSKLPSNALS
jgi:hypothetical protein